MIEVDQHPYVMIPIDKIVPSLHVRRISPSGLKRIQASMERSGFLDNYPVIVTSLGDGTYQLIDGRHRYESARELDISPIPCVVKDDLTTQERYKLALQSNEAAETVVPSTLVTYAEFIWARLREGWTHLEIADDIQGWSESKVKNYSALSKVSSEAWDVIVTSFEYDQDYISEEVVTSKVTTVTFTETLLRSILNLTPEQQLDLVTRLATEKDFTKGKFKTQAENFQARNEMKDCSLQALGDMGKEYTSSLIDAIDSGAYDTEWKADKDHNAHPKLDKLIQATRDEWERKNSLHLVHGDFYEEVAKVGNGSIDLILTDPPYNIARENEFELEGRSNISQDFGEWDKYTFQQFIDLFPVWAREWKRILREQGSGYVFTSDRYISSLRDALEREGLHVKATIVWHKTNPGTQVVKTNFKSSVEYILFFTKGEGGHTFNWQGENEMHNFIESPICAGSERILDAKGNTRHPAQKPRSVVKHLMDVSSNRGDMIFDGFMGVGTTGWVAKNTGRKFIGIEQDRAFFDDTARSLAE